MARFLRSSLGILSLLAFVFSMWPVPVFAQSASDILNLGNKPVNYDSSLQIGRGFKSADSIDSCLQRKEFNFNEIHNIWVEGLVRCKYNSKGVLSKATAQGVSTEPADEQACARKRSGEIIVQGTPSEEEARRWSERCSYLGTVGGAGPITTSNLSGTSSSSTVPGAPRVATQRPTTTTTYRPTNVPPSVSTGYSDQELSVLSQLVTEGRVRVSGDSPTPKAERDRLIAERTGRPVGSGGTSSTGSTTTTNYRPVYDGPGVQVPSEDLIPQGISRKRSLSELIIFYTNVTLPYVSVVAVFAFVASGIFYILSFANEELSGKAKTIMTYVVIGIVIIFSAYTIVNTLLSFVTLE